MASKQSTVDFILKQTSALGTILAKKMFGEYSIYSDGKIIALVCDDKLFVKPTEAGRAYIENVIESSPYPSAKPHYVIANEKLNEREWLTELFRITTTELHLPKSRTK